MEEKNKRIIELSDSDFLSFLYAEREREESLNSFQGWNNWAVAGAIVAALCACYNILKSNSQIDVLNTAYYLSGILSALFCLRPYSFLFSRKRGIDYLKVKFLKDVAPKHYLSFALFFSVVFSVFFPVVDKESPWSIVSIVWIIATVIFLITVLAVYKNKDRLVRPDIDGLLFYEDKWERWFGGIIGGVLSVLCVQSFKIVSTSFRGSPDFELAVCFAAIVVLLYLLARINLRDTMSKRLDVLLDEYLYKGQSKESIYHQVLIHRMGYGVMDACYKELTAMESSIKAFEPQIQKIEVVGEHLAAGTFNLREIRSYIDSIQQTKSFSIKMSDEIGALGNRLDQIVKIEPDIRNTEEFKEMISLQNSLLKMSSRIMGITNDASQKMLMWVKAFHCKKNGGWCMKECDKRNEGPSLIYRLEMLRISVHNRLSSIIRLRKSCE